MSKQYEWMPVDKAKENTDYFLLVRNKKNKVDVIRAKYFGKFKCPTSMDFEEGEYCEADDKYYCPQGWYEYLHSDIGLDYVYHYLPENWYEPIACMPLPRVPQEVVCGEVGDA